jgi:hypothetical protein
MIGGHLSGTRRRLIASNKIHSRDRRWRVRQMEEDEMDEALLGFGTEKNSSSVEQSAH